MRYIYLPFVDIVRSMGVASYLTQILFHDVIAALMLFLVMNPLLSAAWDWRALAESYVYFIPYFSLLAGIASFENEHFSGISEDLAQRPLLAWLTRQPFVVTQTLLPLVFFTVAITQQLPQAGIQVLFLFAYWTLFSSLGVFCALNWGFKREKSINNALNLIPWILALGPGPFLSKKSYAWISIFPGSLMRNGYYEAELLKLGVLLILALAMAVKAQEPRRHRLFRLG